MSAPRPDEAEAESFPTSATEINGVPTDELWPALPPFVPQV